MMIDIEALKDAKDENVDVVVNGMKGFWEFARYKHVIFNPEHRYYFWYLGINDVYFKLGRIDFYS